MKIFSENIELSTKGFTDIVNITAELQQILKRSKLANGQATITSIGSTAGLTTLEYEPGLIKDIQEHMEKMFPYKKDYAHHRTWGCDNGAAHLRSAWLGTTLALSFTKGRFDLGTWQQVVLMDFDTSPRQRQIKVQFLGE